MKILKLPILVKELVFEMMDKGEILDLNLTSKRMRRIIQSTKVKKDYKVNVNVGTKTIAIHGIRLYMADLGNQPRHGGSARTMSFNGKEVLVEMNDPYFHFHWETTEQQLDGFHEMIEYLLARLDINISFLCCVSSVVPTSKTLQFLEAKEFQFEDVKFDSSDSVTMEPANLVFSYKFLGRIKNCLEATLPDDFVMPKYPDSASLNIQELYLRNSGSFNIGHLLSLKKASVIMLYSSSLENKDIREFLQSWRNGNFQELRSFSISTSHKLSVKESTMDLVDEKRILSSTEVRVLCEKVHVYGQSNLKGKLQIATRDGSQLRFRVKTVEEVAMDN